MRQDESTHVDDSDLGSHYDGCVGVEGRKWFRYMKVERYGASTGETELLIRDGRTG